MMLPMQWRPYFTLPPLEGWRLGLGDTHKGVSLSGTVWPRMAVLPMGWAHALSICQQVTEHAADAAGLPENQRITDRRETPVLEKGGHLEYVDNLASLALDRITSQQLTDRMVKQLRESGLPVHEETEASLTTQLLGWVLDGSGGRVRPTPRRAWRPHIICLRALRSHPSSCSTWSDISRFCSWRAGHSCQSLGQCID